MNIVDTLRLKFPDADFLTDIILRDDGDGTYIEQWNVVGTPKPTQAVLDQWAIDVDLEYRQDQAIQARKKEYPSEADLIVALWEDVVEGRPEARIALQASREATKLKSPIPTE